MNARLERFLREQKSKVEKALEQYIRDLQAPEQLKEAMAYSLLAGGKRIRPAFLLATIDALGKDISLGIPGACAVEMVHTYSLIHDDLPAMDDDDYRRGKLTNHKVFGEALAILAGDALLTYAFDVLTRPHPFLTCQQQLEMVRELAFRAGPAGMVGGQTADVLGEEKELSLEEVQYIHRHKTGDMLVCSVRMGCIAAGATPGQLELLTRYAQEVGIAFQIQDDILDEIGDSKRLGKQVGSDQKNGKNTYVKLLGLKQAKKALEDHIDRAKKVLAESGVKQELLLDLADFVRSRDS